MSEEENKGFKVSDRRIHAEDAEDGTDDSAAEEAPVEETPAEEEEAAQDDDAGAADPGEDIPINFATFVISLGDSAMIHLGAIPHPATGERTPDLRAARQTIDILGILEEKTRGNLSDEEQKLMSNLLYALRMQFVQSGQGS
jgi:hypothetical protein